MPYNPEIMINNLDFKFKTLMLSNSCPTNVASMNLTTPKTTKNVVQSSIKLKFKIIIHQNNSSSQLYNLIDV